MVGAAAIVAILGERLLGRPVGLLGGLVFALLPAISRFSHEVRSYALVVLIAALSTLLLLRAMERATFLRWGSYALALAFGMCLNAVSGAIIAGHLVGLVIWQWGRWNWRPVVGFVGAVIAGGALATQVLLLGNEFAFVD